MVLTSIRTLDSEADASHGTGGVLEGAALVVATCVPDGDTNGCSSVCYDAKGDNEENCCTGE